MASTEDLKNWLAERRSVSYGTSFGIIIGSVVFAITQNPVWLGLGIVFGIAAGAGVQANRK